MKQFIFSAAAVALATTSFTPAFATSISLNSLPVAQRTAIQTSCTGFVPGNSNFIATPVDLDDTVQTGLVIDTVVIQNIPAGTELSRTPATFDAGSEHKNGQSPNVFGDFTSIVTYSGGLNIVDVTTADRHHVTYGCRLTKPTGELAPKGQQVANDGTHFVNYDTNTSTSRQTVSLPNYTRPFTEDRVICISPTKNPGVWRAQNGYTAQTCSTSLYTTVNPGGTHSNSVPGLTPLGPTTSSSLSLPLDALESAPLPYDPETDV